MTDVQQTYEKIANWMDKNKSRTLFEKPWLDKVINCLKPQAKILDLGCGTGVPIGKYFKENNFGVTGVDSSSEMLKLARKHDPSGRFINSDMREISLNEKFDAIIAWHSFFHLSQDEQRKMFIIFARHLNDNGILIFTSGEEDGEVWGENGGQMLYHASLSQGEYKSLLKKHGFHLLEYKIMDPECGDASIWLAEYKKSQLG